MLLPWNPRPNPSHPLYPKLPLLFPHFLDLVLTLLLGIDGGLCTDWQREGSLAQPPGTGKTSSSNQGEKDPSAL